MAAVGVPNLMRRAFAEVDRPVLADTRPWRHLLAVNISAVFRPYQNGVQVSPASALSVAGALWGQSMGN